MFNILYSITFRLVFKAHWVNSVFYSLLYMHAKFYEKMSKLFLYVNLLFLNLVSTNLKWKLLRLNCMSPSRRQYIYVPIYLRLYKYYLCEQDGRTQAPVAIAHIHVSLARLQNDQEVDQFNRDEQPP